MYGLFDYVFLFLTLGWIPILAIGIVIKEIKDNKCIHDLEYEEISIMGESGQIPQNISVSVTCKRCGYHKTYLKYKN